MKKKAAAARDSLSWAGSNPGDGNKSDRLLIDALGQDTYKLHEIKHKLDDDRYVDGAVTKIASFLTSTLKKRKDNE